VNVAAAAFVLAPALALGGFVDVVVRRVPAGRSVVRPPSSCDTCSTVIRWPDLIPLLSYLVLRGRCRHCRARIPRGTPVVEAIATSLIVAPVAALGMTVGAMVAAAAGVLLVALVAIGLQRRA
jgi:prepilin signal peptidase PulO-like enzyme (type II secretory pathway)